MEKITFLEKYSNNESLFNIYENWCKINKIYNKNNLFSVISVIGFAAWTAFQHQHLSETFQQESFLHRAKIGSILVVNDVYNVKHNKWQKHPGAHISAGVREGKEKRPSMTYLLWETGRRDNRALVFHLCFIPYTLSLTFHPAIRKAM